MQSDVLIAILSLIGTLAGAFLGVIKANSVVSYRLEQLEKKVDKHNHVMERVFKLEAQAVTQHDDIEELKRHDEARS